MSGNTRGLTKHRTACPDCGRDVPVGWNKRTGDPWTGRHRCNGVLRSGVHVDREATYMPEVGRHRSASEAHPMTAAPDPHLTYVGYREDPAVLAELDVLAGGKRKRSLVIRRATAELVARERRKRERAER